MKREMLVPQPWEPGQATRIIRELARGEKLHLAITRHCGERLNERGLLMSDLLYVLKNGFVYEEPEPSTNPHFHKYKMESETPNSNGRIVRAVVIPDARNCTIKAVTIMWVDER